MNLFQPNEFTIDTRAVARPKGERENIACTISNPSGAITEKVITPQADGTYRVSYSPFEEGQHKIDILYDNMPVPGSPFNVNVSKVCDATKCRAYGPGLQKAIVNKTNQFTVEMKGVCGFLIIVRFF